MDKQEQIREGLRNLAAKVGPRATLLAKVKSVNEGENTCVLFDDETKLEYHDVRLRPVLDGKESLSIYPKQGAWMLAVKIEQDDDWMSVAVSEVDKWRLKIGQATIEQSANGLLIQKQSDTLRQSLELIIEAVMNIVVVQGQNPDYVKLQQAQVKIQNILQ